MKRFLAFLLFFCITVSLYPAVQASSAVMKEFYVDPLSGKDSGDGSASSPFATVERARTAVGAYIESIDGNMTGDIVVNLAEGRYELSEYLQFREGDSGKNGFKVVYQGAGAKKSVISGGLQISGWERASGGIWTADAPQLEFARDLYVNERTARRAASQTTIKGVANYHEENSYYDTSDGFYVNKSQMQKFNNPEDVVLHWTYTWKDSQICVKDIIEDPENSEQLIVKLENPAWNGLVESAATAARPNLIVTYDKDFIVENALELLDEPGEFYFDKKLKKLYYYPLEDEDMQTAQVIVPRLERLVRIDGSNYHHQVTSIAFRDVGFAHATNPLGENTSYSNQQGECPTSPQQAANRTPGAFEVNWANNIEISDCAVWGTELVGIFFNEGVSDSSITGTGITDTGSAAAVIGNSRTSTGSPSANATVMGDPKFPTEFADAANLANVIYLKRWRASYNYVIDGSNAMHFFNGGSLGHEFEYRSGTAASGINAQTWKNEPWAEHDGIKSWVMFDLEKEYNLEYIRLSFEEDCAGVKPTEQEKSNFEVLLSNDESFEDYVVVKTFTQAAEDVEMFRTNVEDKYRYLMIRKTVAEPFAIYGVWAYSGDREPIGTYGLCQNITFENNYIARAARTHNQAPAVLVHLTKGVSVRHNDILDSAYTGISLGWGWESVNYSTADNVIENNLIDNFSLRTDDGGGIYILGNQRNLQIKGNYVKNQGNMYGGIYFDSGSSNAVVENNVVLNTSNTFMFWNDANEISTGPIQLRNNYSDMSRVARYAGDAYIDWEDINVFTPDNPPDEAVSIMTTAGLQEGYRYLRETERPQSPWLKGPEMSKSYHRTENASTRALAFKSVAENLLANAQFGTLPWQYSYEDYYTIEKALADINNSSNRVTDYSNGHILEEYALKEAIETANEGIVHPTYEEMVELCETLISGADTNSYPQTAISALSDALSTEKASAPQTEVEKALSATQLERAVSVFESSRIGADLEYAYVVGGETVVDRENRKTTITLPFAADLTGLNIRTVISPGAELLTDISSADFSKPVLLTIKNTDTGLTAQWTLEIKNEEPSTEEALVLGMAAENWINLNPNTVMPIVNGALMLQPADRPYIYDKVAETSAEWKIMAYSPETDKNISLLFGGKSKSIEPGVKEKNNSYYRLTLSGQTMTLSYAEDGTETVLTSGSSVNFSYGEFNHIKAVYEQDEVKVYVNDTAVITAAQSDAEKFKGYCGVYNPGTIVAFSGRYEGEMVNGALNKPAFANAWRSSNAAQDAVDGNAESYFMSNGSSSYGYRLIIDLESEYPICAIDYLAYSGNSSEYGSNLSFYASNDPAFETKKEIYSQAEGETFEGTSVVRLWPDTINEYRYVMVEKAASTGDLAICDFQVMVPKKYEAELTDASSVACVSKRQTVKDAHNNKTAANLTSEEVEDAYGQASSVEKEIYAFIDLGKAVPISYIAISSHIPLGVTDSASLGLYELYRKNFQLVATNDPSFNKTNDVLIAFEESSVSPDGLMLYPLDELSGNYRYVGVRGLSVDGQIPRLRLNQLDVYAKTESIDEFFLPAEIEKTETELVGTVSGVTAAEKSYYMVAGYYDKNNRLYYSQAKTVSSGADSYGTISQEFDYPSKSGIVKVFLWDSADNMKPVAVGGKLDIQLLPRYVCISDSSVAYQKAGTGAAVNKGDILRDGIEGMRTDGTYSICGVGPVGNECYVWLDLGEEQRVDRVETTIFDTQPGARPNGSRYYLSNVAPDNGMTEDDLVLIGTVSGAANTGTTYVTFDVPDTMTGNYRYVIARIGGAADGSLGGGYIGEMDVYTCVQD